MIGCRENIVVLIIWFIFFRLLRSLPPHMCVAQLCSFLHPISHITLNSQIDEGEDSRQEFTQTECTASTQTKVSALHQASRILGISGAVVECTAGDPNAAFLGRERWGRSGRFA